MSALAHIVTPGKTICMRRKPPRARRIVALCIVDHSCSRNYFSMPAVQELELCVLQIKSVDDFCINSFPILKYEVWLCAGRVGMPRRQSKKERQEMKPQVTLTAFVHSETTYFLSQQTLRTEFGRQKKPPILHGLMMPRKERLQLKVSTLFLEFLECLGSIPFYSCICSCEFKLNYRELAPFSNAAPLRSFEASLNSAAPRFFPRQLIPEGLCTTSELNKNHSTASETIGEIWSADCYGL